MMKNKKQIIYMATGFFLMALLWFVFHHNKSNEIEPFAYSQFPVGAVIKARYIDSNGAEEKKFTIADKKTYLDVNAVSRAYQISYAVEIPNQSIIDITIDVNKVKKQIKAILTNAPLDTKLSLILNEKPVQKSTPVDWAGKIALKKSDINFNKNQNLCLEMDFENSHSLYILCHKTQERQASS